MNKLERRIRELTAINEDLPKRFKDKYASDFINRYFEDAKKVELSHEYEDEPFDFDDFC